MELGNKEYVYFIIIPILIMIFMIFGYRKKIKILNRLRLQNRSLLEKMRILLILSGSLLAVIALLSPQKLLHEENRDVRGMNIYVLVDVSRSMMTEDVFPNRLEGAKRILQIILDNLRGDRVGFIPFSDSAYIQMPLTDDYSIGRNYINAIDGNLISGGGTNLYEGLLIANKSLEELESQNKTVVILSDGGDEDQNSLDFAIANGINVYSVGIGTNDGGVVPLYENGVRSGFIRDASGSPAVSKLNSEFLKKISQENNGRYYEVNNLNNNFYDFFSDIENMDRNNIREEKVREYKKYFQIPLGIGILLILIGFLMKGKVRDEK